MLKLLKTLEARELAKLKEDKTLQLIEEVCVTPYKEFTMVTDHWSFDVAREATEMIKKWMEDNPEESAELIRNLKRESILLRSKGCYGISAPKIWFRNNKDWYERLWFKCGGGTIEVVSVVDRNGKLFDRVGLSRSVLDNY